MNKEVGEKKGRRAKKGGRKHEGQREMPAKDSD